MTVYGMDGKSSQASNGASKPLAQRCFALATAGESGLDLARLANLLERHARANPPQEANLGRRQAGRQAR